MELIFKKNDAFRVLQSITRDAIPNLEKKLMFRLKDERFISGDPEDCGKSLDDICSTNGMEMEQFIPIIFRGVEFTKEIPELIKHVWIVASGSDNPCPECGCELESETDGGFGINWMDTQCSNTDCDYKTTDEPDWDIAPGGYSFDN